VRGLTGARTRCGSADNKGETVAFMTKVAPTPERDALSARNGARWFYWIAGLSVINSLAAFAGADFMFFFGLTSTLIATYLGIKIGGAASIIGMVVAVLVSLGFVGLAWMAERGAKWAFVTGLVLYGLDAAVTLYFQDWLSGFAHVAAVVIIAMGLLASQRLQKAGLPLAVQPGAGAVAPASGSAVGAPAAAGMPLPGQASTAPPAPLSDVPRGFAEAKAPAPLD